MGNEPTINQAVGGVLARLLFPTAEEIGKTFGEKYREWRKGNLRAVSDLADEEAKQKGITESNKREIPFGHLVALTEAASQEEEPTIQEMWAQLLVNSIDPQKTIVVSKMFVELLRQFGPLEAKFLHLIDRLFRGAQFKTLDEIKRFNTEMREFAESEWRCYPAPSREVAIQNLTRLRCITYRPKQVDITGLFSMLDPSSFGSPSRGFAAINAEKLRVVFEKLVKITLISGGGLEPDDKGPIPLVSGSGIPFKLGELEFPEMNYQLTSVGRALLEACSR